MNTATTSRQPIESLQQPDFNPTVAQQPQGSPSGQRCKNVGRAERLISVASGAALVMFGLKRLSPLGIITAGAGAALIYRGSTGHCSVYDALGIDTTPRREETAVPAQQGVHAEKSVMINCSAERLFDFWRNVDKLPRVMRHVTAVQPIDKRRSQWTAKDPLGRELTWEAEIFNERQGELIAWRSLPGGDLETAGTIHFEPLENGRGTAVRVTMKYNPPAGKIADRVASLFGQGLAQQIAADLQRFKSLMEAGEIPTTDGQTSGRTTESSLTQGAKQ
jgi:uncharacterized membrane protein